MTRFSDIQTAYVDFPEGLQSLMLSTLRPDGQPQASYAPFVMDGERQFYVFVSGLSSHTQNLKTTAKAGILLIEDESSASQVFARKRLMYDCTAELIERHNPQWTIWADRFQGRFGALIEMLRQLPDFQIITDSSVWAVCCGFWGSLRGRRQQSEAAAANRKLKPQQPTDGESRDSPRLSRAAIGIRKGSAFYSSQLSYVRNLCDDFGESQGRMVNCSIQQYS